MEKYSKLVYIVWEIAAHEAAYSRSQYIETEHVLIGLCKLEKFQSDPDILNDISIEKHYIDEVLLSVKLDPTRLRRHIRRKMGVGSYQPTENVIHRSLECKGLFERAEELTDEGITTCRELLIASMENPSEIISSAFDDLDVDLPDFLSHAISYLIDKKAQGDGLFGQRKDKDLISITPNLDKYGRDLTQEAKDGKLGSLIGRRSEMLQIIQILARMKKNNPVLVGEAGVGKTALVEGIAQRIVQGKDVNILGGKRLIELNISYLISGSSFRGEFEDRLNKIISEVEANPEIILFIDEIHTIVGAGRIGDGSLDAGNILKPALARGNFRCIGATTISEFRKYIELDPALERRFEMIMVFEPSREETLEILQGIIPRLERHHNTQFTAKALEAAVDLSIRFDTGHQLPDKAISLLDTAGSNAVVPNLSMIHSPSDENSFSIDSTAKVDENVIAEIVSRKTGIDIGVISPYIGKTYLDRIKQIAYFLEDKIIGQDDAIERVANRLLLAQSGLAGDTGPLATFLFTGPSGVGKTQFALNLAEFLFGTPESVIRLDMSEYKEEHSVSKLIGSPPGYIGYEEEGQLTSKLRTHPFSVVLLDECEKAHPRVWDMFLQVFDAGRITDSKGRTIDMRNSVFIMTSNISSVGPGSLSKSEKVIENETISKLSEYFRIEFLNRFDDIIVFRMLDEADARKILNLELEVLKERVKSQHKIDLVFTNKAIEYLLYVGYSPLLGVRELKRVIEKMVLFPLSLAIADRIDRNTDWVFDVKNDELIIV